MARLHSSRCTVAALLIAGPLLIGGCLPQKPIAFNPSGERGVIVGGDAVYFVDRDGRFVAEPLPAPEEVGGGEFLPHAWFIDDDTSLLVGFDDRFSIHRLDVNERTLESIAAFDPPDFAGDVQFDWISLQADSNSPIFLKVAMDPQESDADGYYLAVVDPASGVASWFDQPMMSAPVFDAERGVLWWVGKGASVATLCRTRVAGEPPAMTEETKELVLLASPLGQTLALEAVGHPIFASADVRLPMVEGELDEDTAFRLYRFDAGRGAVEPLLGDAPPLDGLGFSGSARPGAVWRTWRRTTPWLWPNSTGRSCIDRSQCRRGRPWRPSRRSGSTTI